MPLASSLIGQTLSGYRVQSLLGRGGMSEVYAAHDLRLGRDVALKVLNPQLALNESFRDRFLRESRLASSLEHPHIVPIFEAGDGEGLLYIAMRLVEGTDLRALISDKGTLSPSQVARIVFQTASALDAAHAHGLIHRDVKPANILIATDRAEKASEHVYLTDFGLTKTVGSDSRYTETGQLVGSVHYMAPEQIEGKEVTPRADVYSLGCVLFEALTGRPPYERESDLAVLWAHVNGDLPVITSERADLKPAVGEVVARALSKSPEDRYHSCGELSADLRRALRRRTARTPLGRNHASSRTATPSPVSETVSPPVQVARWRVGALTAGRLVKRLTIAALVLSLSGSAVVGFARVTGLWRPDDRIIFGDSTPGVSDGSTGENVAKKAAAERNKGSRATNRPRSDRSTTEDSGLDTSQSAVVQAASTGTRGLRPTAPEVREAVRTTKRTVTESYGPASLAETQWSDCLSGDTAACVDFFPRSDENYISVEIEDSNSRHVTAWIRQDLDGDRRPDGEWTKFCDYTDSPIRITPGAVVNIMLVKGDCRHGGNSAPTTGTIRVTFYNKV